MGEDVRMVIFCGDIVAVSITESKWGLEPVGVYKTSDFRKGLKVQIDGEPYLIVEMNFVKPGKGNAMYKCRLRNLIRGSVLDRTYKGGDSLESADVEEIEVQFLYRQVDTFVFMDNKSYEQYELSAEQVDDNWKYLKEGMACAMVLWKAWPARWCCTTAARSRCRRRTTSRSRSSIANRA